MLGRTNVGGGGTDSFMELIGATQMVEMTYTPTARTSNTHLPNTMGRRYKGVIFEAQDHSADSDWNRYVDCLIAQLDDTVDDSTYARAVPAGKVSASGRFEFVHGNIGADVYIVNELNVGLYVHFNYSIYFQAGKTYDIKLFY